MHGIIIANDLDVNNKCIDRICVNVHAYVVCAVVYVIMSRFVLQLRDMNYSAFDTSRKYTYKFLTSLNPNFI